MTAYILDTETTGLTEPHATEIAYCIVDINENGVKLVQKTRSKRYNPGKPIELGSMATSHIVDEDVANEPPHTTFELPASVKYLIGHNVDYDMSVLVNAGVTRTPRLVCTKAMSSKLLPNLDSHKLVALLYYFDLKYAKEYAHNAHAAAHDVDFTAKVLHHLIGVANDTGERIVDIESLYQFSEFARIPTHFDFGKHKGSAIADVARTDRNYMTWVVKNITGNPYLVDACKAALSSQ